MFGLFTGRRFCNEMAKTLGVDKALLSSALLETGITWNFIEKLKADGMSAEQAVKLLMPEIMLGLNVIHKKFGTQDMLIIAARTIIAYCEEHGLENEGLQ